MDNLALTVNPADWRNRGFMSLCIRVTGIKTEKGMRSIVEGLWHGKFSEAEDKFFVLAGGKNRSITGSPIWGIKA